MGDTGLRVVHVASGEAEALETLRLVTRALASAGFEQLVFILGAAAAPGLLKAVETRRVRPDWRSPFRMVAALQERLAPVLRERPVYAVHLYGTASSLLAGRAMRGTALASRVLISPHLGRWPTAVEGLLVRLLLAQLGDRFAAMTASLHEAHALSRLTNRSVEILPVAVPADYFAVARAEDAPLGVAACGEGGEAIGRVTRLAVLLNGRAARVPFTWLGNPGASALPRLRAAHVEVLDLDDHAVQARLLSHVAAFIHVSPGRAVPHAVARAMAVGVPCLVSDTPSHRSLVRHGETGLVCTSERDLLEKLTLLLRDPGERRRLGEAARAEAVGRFTEGNFEGAVLRAYGFAATGSTLPA